ncbi:MAG: phosphate acyltransferase, partial [Bacteroidota bacterium]
VSSFFVMAFPEHVLFYADCAVVPSPTVEQLSDIAAMTSVHYQKLTNNNPKVAFLSFSTKGSSAHQDAKKVNDACTLFKSKYPHIIADGELQLDAALIPQIAQKKAPESPLSGDANILIFPDLDAGNIAYKISERLAGASAIGPIVQGLNKPYCDLSRGCSMEDIIDVALICMSM